MAGSATTIRDRYSGSDIDAFYASGLWQEQSFYSLIAQRAASDADRRFCFDSTTSCTYRELRERVLRTAAGFTRLGIQRGERVAVQLPNWTEFPIVVGALSRIGAITVPIMPIYRSDEVGYVLRQSGAVAVVTCREFRGFDHAAMFADMRNQVPHLRLVVVARAGDGLGADLHDLAAVAAAGDLADLEREAGADSHPDDGFLIVYTSGTTNRPKGCYHSFNTYCATARSMVRELEYTREDVQFGPSPITHTTGLVTSVVIPLLAGAQTHFMEVWDAADALRRISEHRLTAAVTATPFLQMLLSAYDPNVHDATSLRIWVCAGSPIPGAIIEQALAAFPACRTLSLYGRSENLVTTMCSLTDGSVRAISTDGKAVGGASVKIVDDAGHEVARGQVGDIAYRGPSHMIEYYDEPEETEALFTKDGFSRSGDLGRMDADGYVRVTGRLKDIIIRGGMNISALEIEEHLVRHPAIDNVAAVGMPDERLGEKVCVFAVLAPGADAITLNDLTAYLKSHGVATPKLPERLELVPALPLTATGKVQKHVLRAEIASKLK